MQSLSKWVYNEDFHCIQKLAETQKKGSVIYTCLKFIYIYNMNRKDQIELDFLVDKLTNSIENINSGDSFPTEVSLLHSEELKKITKKTVGYLIGKTKLKTRKLKFTN